MSVALTLLILAVACPSDPPPNIVIVYADDLGWGDVAAQNPSSRIPTPHMDRLAAESLRLVDAHSSSGICTPSRFALLTGQYHWRRMHRIVMPYGPSVFEESDVTLAELFREAGYDTACIGKWHLGWDWASIWRGEGDVARRGVRAAADFDWSQPVPDGPLAHGFDHYFGDDVPNFPPYAWIEDDRVVVAPTVPLEVTPTPAEGSAESRPGPMVEGWRQDAVMPQLTERAVAWLEEPARRERPFFLYFAWTSPHTPISPAQPWHGTTEVGGYGDFVHQSDAHLGALLEALEATGLADNTLLVFTADNGPEHYAYPRTKASGHRSTGPLRGLKRDIFEGGHRVPCLVRWPGVVAPGRVSTSLFGQIDLFRTLAGAAGLEVPEGAAPDSLDQLPVWRGEERSVRTSLVHNTFAGRWALRHDDWVLVEGPTGAHSRIPDDYRSAEGLEPFAGEVGLFDLSRDLGQQHDRAAEYPDLVAELRAELEALKPRR